MSASSDTVLREALAGRLDHLDVPPGDLPAAMRRGRSRRERRFVGGAIAMVATAALVGVVLTVGPRIGGDADVATFPSIGAIDASQGLRAYADPGFSLHLGGRDFSAQDLAFLDTDAIATPDGVAFYDDGRPYLLGLDGETESLVDGPVDPLEERGDGGGFHPTAKAGVDGALAYASMTDGVVTVWLREDPTDDDAASTEAPCAAVCGSLVIDAVDQDLVYGHTDDGTFVWDVAAGEWRSYATGPGFRIADVRAGTVLYSGHLPTDIDAALDTRAVQAPVDATLTFDGRYVLDWSGTLRPVDPTRDDPVDVGVPGVRGDDTLAFYAFDTDGSLLAAVPEDVGDPRTETAVYDCATDGSGCDEVDELRFRGGDPAFLGADM